MAQMTQSSRRKLRVRKTLSRRANDRPRLSVFRSHQNIYAQVIDDGRGVVMLTPSGIG